MFGLCVCVMTHTVLLLHYSMADTPLDVARNNNYQDIVDLLKRVGQYMIT